MSAERRLNHLIYSLQVNRERAPLPWRSHPAPGPIFVLGLHYLGALRVGASLLLDQIRRYFPHQLFLLRREFFATRAIELPSELINELALFFKLTLLFPDFLPLFFDLLELLRDGALLDRALRF
jgi:hypothetical protein